MSDSEVNSLDSEFPISSYFWRVLGKWNTNGKKLRELSHEEMTEIVSIEEPGNSARPKGNLLDYLLEEEK